MTAFWRTLSGHSELPIDDDLVREAADEGFHFIERLLTEWRDSVNRFDKPDETLLGAFLDGRMIAVGGLNRDFAHEGGVGRLRHLYVRPAFRGRGLGSELVERLEAHARLRFDTIRLRTDTPEAARFYTRRGYSPVDSDSATHVLRFSPADGR
jgi:GNAT superfamily N-acetyltransferase